MMKPISKGFYNWRDKRNEKVMGIKRVMSIPVQGIVENSEDNLHWIILIRFMDKMEL